MTGDDEGRAVAEAVADAKALVGCDDFRLRGLARHVLALAGMLERVALAGMPGRGQPDRRHIPAGTYACTMTTLAEGKGEAKLDAEGKGEAKLDAEGKGAWPLIFPFDGVPPMRVGDRFEVELVPAAALDGG